MQGQHTVQQCCRESRRNQPLHETSTLAYAFALTPWQEIELSHRAVLAMQEQAQAQTTAQYVRVLQRQTACRTATRQRFGPPQLVFPFGARAPGEDSEAGR